MIQQPFFLPVFARKRCRTDNSKTAPTKGINASPGLASGTARMGRSGALAALAAIACAFASTGRIKLAAIKAPILLT
jgi:hypothetical protein